MMKILIPFVLLVAGCAEQNQSKIQERANLEAQETTKAEQEVLMKKAKEMEADLTMRHSFYSTIEGIYQGFLDADGDKYNIKLNIQRSIPEYKGDRIRQISEIEADLNSLFFNVQIVQWHPSDEATAVGCRVSQIKPDMTKGTLSVSSVDCPNLYSIFLSDMTQGIFVPGEKSKDIASKITSKQILSVEKLIGTIQPTSSAKQFSFEVYKSMNKENL